MKNKKIKPIKRLTGTIALKGDKSISHRSVMISSIAEGRSRIKNFANSGDCFSTVMAFKQLGISIDVSGDSLTVEGKGLKGLARSDKDIYLGNSGTSMRLLSGILAGQEFESKLTGDESLSSRPMDRIIEPLRLMGADIKGRDDRYAPLVIKGGALKAVNYRTRVASAQVKSAIIFAALYAEGVTEIEEPVKSRDHTERMLSLFGARMVIGERKVSIDGMPDLKAREISIPGDISSAAFFMVAASILDGSEIRIKGLLCNCTRTGIIDTLRDMGADINMEAKRFSGCEDVCDVVVRRSKLNGIDVKKDRIPSVIDELPVLLVAAVFAEGRTRIHGAGELRVKETDRIASMTGELKKMGADITVQGDDIYVNGTGELKGAKLESFGDHRTAMSLAIASIAAKGESEISGIDCVDTSFPGFFGLLDSAGKR